MKFTIPGPPKATRLYMAIRRNYAASIGATFDRPANDNGARFAAVR